MRKRTDTWMPLYIADYMADTAHLNTEQHGAYLLLLMTCWKRGGSVPADDAQLASIARLPVAMWRRHKSVIMAMFQADDGIITHKRVLSELQKAQELSEKRREAGAKGGRPSSQEESKTKPNGSQKDTQTETPTRVALPSPSPPPPEVISDADASSGVSAEPKPPEADLLEQLVQGQAAKPEPRWRRDKAFTEAWEACTDGMRSRSDSREKTWPVWVRASLKAGGPELLLAAVKAYVAKDADAQRTGGPAFHRWLRDGKWEHWLGRHDAAVSPKAVWMGPAELRAAVVARSSLGEDWAASYIDRSAWRYLPTPTLTPTSAFAAKVICTEIGDILRAHGATIEVESRGAA